MNIIFQLLVVFNLNKSPILFIPKDYAYVLSYSYNQVELKSRPNHHIYSLENGFATSIVLPGDTLSKEKVQNIANLFSRGTFGLLNGLSSCFIPRHGLVFYSSENKPVASVSICFECERIDFWNPLNQTKHFKEKLDEKKAQEIMLELKKILD